MVGCNRWVDSETVLLVFPSPGIAATALARMKREGHAVQPYSKAQSKCLHQPLRELQPPKPRPETHAGMAIRLIAANLNSPSLLHQPVSITMPHPRPKPPPP